MEVQQLHAQTMEAFTLSDSAALGFIAPLPQDLHTKIQVRNLLSPSVKIRIKAFAHIKAMMNFNDPPTLAGVGKKPTER